MFRVDKMVWFFSRRYVSESSKSSALRGSIGIRPHVYQGFSLRWLFNDSQYTLFFIFYRPFWIIPPLVKLFDFSVSTMEVNHQIHRHSEGRSASGSMFIRGFPLHGYLMTVSTPTCVYLSPVVNYSFTRLYGGESSNSSAFRRSIGIGLYIYQEFPPI